MAKSLRSKTKRDHRSKKREDGIYAATEAARLHRLNAKLLAVAKGVQEDDSMPQDEEDEDADQLALEPTQPTESGDAMTLDEPAPAKKISTHGPRNSRREQWRASKGLDPKPKRDGVNRQGVLAGRRKAGRSKRRR